MNHIIDKGNCSECGCRLIDYDLNYSNGQIKLCEDCFIDYIENHHVLVKHCPGFVDNGGDFVFYLWEGFDKFIQDYPLKKEWEYRLDVSGYGQGYILINALSKREWWVIWATRNPFIIDEIKKKLPLMKYKEEEE